MDSERYHEMANTLEQQAADETSPGAEEASRELARGYARLAERAERVEKTWHGAEPPACGPRSG